MNRHHAFFYTPLAILALSALSALSISPARAEEPQTPGTSGAPASPSAPASLGAPTSPSLETSRLVSIDAGLNGGYGAYGLQATGSPLGFQAQKIHILDDKKYVLQWDVGAQSEFGALVNTYPINFIYGVRGAVDAEIGRRLVPFWTVSPYFGVAAGASAQAVGVAGVAPSALNTINNSDGAAGLAAQAYARYNVGGSMVLGKNHLELVGFIQEKVLSAQTDAPSIAFTDIGLHLKYDHKDSMALSADALLGKAGDTTSPALGTTTSTNRWAVSLSAVKTFNEHWLGGLTVGVEQDSNTVSKAGSALVLNTSDPVDLSASLFVGYRR